jgi:hypothetical protein
MMMVASGDPVPPFLTAAAYGQTGGHALGLRNDFENRVTGSHSVPNSKIGSSTVGFLSVKSVSPGATLRF